MRESWDDWFISLAQFYAQRSRDPSTKCGAVIVRPDNTVASIGYNGFPRGIDDRPELYENREEKYKRVVHCEMNAVLSAREPLHGYTLYLWPALSCDRCTVHMIQAGIKRVVANTPTEDMLSRWGDSMKLSMSLYEEAGVDVTWIGLRKA